MGLDPGATSFSVRGATVGMGTGSGPPEQASKGGAITCDVASPAQSADVLNFQIRSAGGQVWDAGAGTSGTGYDVNVRVSNGHEGPRRRSVGERCQVEAGGIDVSGYHGSSSNQRVSPGKETQTRIGSGSSFDVEFGSGLCASLRRRRKSEAQPQIGSRVKIGTLSLDQGKVEDGGAIRTTLNSSKETGKVSSLDVSSTSSIGFRRKEIECPLWPVDRGFILPDGVCARR
ncbi:hypothetical protein R1flu_011656 [Riccia fluitans]|uniref:CBM20 domain-containing protein n=1 Tax=Riccia fluitans TaxID=41844 RepID=A0ABD1Z8E8_9MARC